MAEDLRIDVGALLTAELAFIDRHGNYMAPWAVALDLAHRICQTMPGLVLARIDGRERELRENASRGTRRRDRDGLVWSGRFLRNGTRSGLANGSRSSPWFGSGAASTMNVSTSLRRCARKWIGSRAWSNKRSRACRNSVIRRRPGGCGTSLVSGLIVTRAGSAMREAVLAVRAVGVETVQVGLQVLWSDR